MDIQVYKELAKSYIKLYDLFVIFDFVRFQYFQKRESDNFVEDIRLQVLDIQLKTTPYTVA